MIVGYATSKTYHGVVKRSFSEYGDGVVLPENPELRTLTGHFRKTNLEELSSFLHAELHRNRPINDILFAERIECEMNPIVVRAEPIAL